MSIGERIKKIRADLLQEAFAKQLGVSKMTVGRWERGERVPDYENLIAILHGFPEINPAWLLTGEESMCLPERSPTDFDLELVEKFINILDGLEWVLEKRGREMDFERKKGWIRYLYKQLRQENTAEITRDKVEGVIVEVDELNKTREVTI
jgi:transcriptional regulator with XRE-family HTH domain